MRKLKKVSLALLLCVLMLVQSIAVFAEVSPIVYEVNEDGSVTSYVYARDLDKGAKLYTAVYNADGSFAFAKASANADKAGYLKTTVSKEEGQVVKSFLWNNEYTPFGTEGEYGDGIDVNDITITVNGNDLRGYLAEDDELTFGGSYDVDIKDAGFIKVPEVKATSKDSHVKCSVKYSKDNSSATVTFTKGARILSEDTRTITNNAGKSFVAERYTYADEETITVNFAKTYLCDADLVPGSPCGGALADGNLSTLFKKTYTLAEDETVKKISLHLDFFASQGVNIVLRPLDATDGKDVLVNADGSPVEWKDDDGSVYTGSSVLEYDYENGVIAQYNKLSKTALTCNTTAAAVKALSYGDDHKETRSRSLTDRTPNYAMAIYKIQGDAHAALEGCNYIIFNSGDKTNTTLEFYVNKDTEVNVYTKTSTLVVSDVVSGTNVAWDASCKSSNTMYRQYQNSIDAISVAWLVREGKVEPSEITYNRNGNAVYDIDGDGKKETATERLDKILAAGLGGDIVLEANMSAYYIANIGAVKYLIEKSGNAAGWGFDNGLGVKDIPNSILPKYYSEAYKYEDYLEMWEDIDYSSERDALVTDFSHVTTATVEDMPMVVVSGVHKGETATYTGNIAIGAGIQSKIVDFFGLTLTPDRNGLELDANGALKNQNATGALMQYPDGFGLDEATYICFNNGPINDDGYWYGKDENAWYPNKKANYTDYWNASDVSRPWYSFKVARDAEVMVFSTGMLKFLEDKNSGFEKLTLQPADGFKIMRQMVSSDYNCSIVYTKKFKAGETVEMKTPGYAQVLYGVFVKEDAASKADATLASITINGMALEGFDPNVTEYTYALTEEEAVSVTAPDLKVVANDTSSVIKIVKPETFPGSTKIIVNNPNGATKIYTINYTENYEYITGLTSDLPTVTSSPRYYKGGLVVGDNGYLATDRSGKGQWRISQINVPELEGNDTIIGAVDALKGATTITFTLKRPAKMRVLLNSNSAPNPEKPLVNSGFVLNEDISTFKIVGTAGANIRNYPRMLTKEFAAGTYTIPYVKPDMPAVYALEYLPFE